MKTNPQYNYVELSRINVDDIPTNVKKGFNTFPTEGYVCECRVQVSQPDNDVLGKSRKSTKSCE